MPARQEKHYPDIEVWVISSVGRAVSYTHLDVYKRQPKGEAQPKSSCTTHQCHLSLSYHFFYDFMPQV
ncbi:hypothetical protein [Erwinia amylovora]